MYSFHDSRQLGRRCSTSSGMAFTFCAVPTWKIDTGEPSVALKAHGFTTASFATCSWPGGLISSLDSSFSSNSCRRSSAPRRKR